MADYVRLNQVAEGSLSVGDYSQAASSFARAAALYAQGISQNGPDTADSVLSCSSSETSEIIMASEFFPLQEVAGTTEQAPVPDQSWWEEFGEWESASKVSHLPASRHVICLSQPRLVFGDNIVRLPIARPDARLPYSSFPELLTAHSQSVSATQILPKHGALVKVSTQSKFMHLCCYKQQCHSA